MKKNNLYYIFKTIFIITILSIIYPCFALEEKNKGIKVDLGTDIIYDKTSSAENSWTMLGVANINAWGLGNFGFLLRFQEGFSIGDIPSEEDVYKTTWSHLTQIDLAPTIHLKAGPLNMRLALGPWLAYSRMQNFEEFTNYELTTSDITWSSATFLGFLGETKVELKLGPIRPFVSAEARFHGPIHKVLSLDESGISEANINLSGVEIQGRAGFRIHMIKFLYVDLAGIAGYTTASIQPIFSKEQVSRFGGGVSIGASF